MTALAGAGAMAVSLIMMLSPAASAASASLVITARYHGAVSPSNYISSSGCGKVKVSKQWNFNLRTGMGGTVSTGKVSQCGKIILGVGQYSYGNAGGGFQVAIPFKVPAKSTNVTVNAAEKVTGAMIASDGVANNSAPPPKCTNGLNTYQSHYVDYQWGATFVNTSYGGYWYYPNYNYSDWYNSSTYSSHYGYGSGPVPVPFNLNNTSAYYTSASYGASSYCSATVNMYADYSANVVDTTTGAYLYPNATNEPNYVSTYLEVYTSIDWYCSYYFSWNGAYNTTYGSTNYTCYSYNTTLTSLLDSYSYTYYPTFHYNSTYVTGTNNTQTMSLTGTTISYWTFLFPYNSTHKYVLMLSISQSVSGSDSWKKGFGSWAINSATLGNGFKLSNITIT